MRARNRRGRGRLQRGRASRGAAGCGVVFGFRPYREGGGPSRTAPLTLIACLLACAPAPPPEREAREAGPQEKHRGWFRDARITPHAGARVVRLCQGRPVLEHDGGSQLIEREAGTCGESELHG